MMSSPNPWGADPFGSPPGGSSGFPSQNAYAGHFQNPQPAMAVGPATTVSDGWRILLWVSLAVGGVALSAAVSSYYFRLPSPVGIAALAVGFGGLATGVVGLWLAERTRSQWAAPRLSGPVVSGLAVVLAATTVALHMIGGPLATGVPPTDLDDMTRDTATVLKHQLDVTFEKYVVGSARIESDPTSVVPNGIMVHFRNKLNVKRRFTVTVAAFDGERSQVDTDIAFDVKLEAGAMQRVRMFRVSSAADAQRRLATADFRVIEARSRSL